METLQVRRKASLDRVIGTYRLVFLAISLLVVATAAVSLSDVFVFGPARALPTYLVVLRVVAAAGLVGFLRWGYLRIRRDVREAADEQQQLLDSAHRDALTGAYLRSYFHELLKQQLLHRPEVPVGYLQVDMDQLKALNDAQGHAAGDAALRHIAGTIMRLAPQAVLGRLGGDEFGVALVGQDNKAELLRLGERILDEVREEVRVGERTIRISVTVGIAVTPGDAGDMTELMARADLALYRGKRSGRSMVVGYDHDMLVDERHQRFIQRELRAALLLGEIKVYYQPIFAPDGQALLAYEALARWHHAHRGIIPPSQFIPVAEQSDIIDRLGEVVLQQVCADLGRLTAPVSINVSPVQLRRAGFAAGFAAILLDAGIAGNRIVVEITENVLMRAGGIESENLAALRQLGVRIAIDDLGTGHASLEYLRSFAFDIIKIDRSYTAHLLTSRVDRMIVSAICDIARAMDVEVIAEGVETQEQLEALRQLGCDAMQGYLFGRPAPLALLEPGRSIASAA